MILIHKLAHHVITISKFVFAMEESEMLAFYHLC